MSMKYSYVLLSERDGKFYIDCAEDLRERMQCQTGELCVPRQIGVLSNSSIARPVGAQTMRTGGNVT